MLPVARSVSFFVDKISMESNTLFDYFVHLFHNSGAGQLGDFCLKHKQCQAPGSRCGYGICECPPHLMAAPDRRSCVGKGSGVPRCPRTGFWSSVLSFHCAKERSAVFWFSVVFSLCEREKRRILVFVFSLCRSKSRVVNEIQKFNCMNSYLRSYASSTCIRS